MSVKKNKSAPSEKSGKSIKREIAGILIIALSLLSLISLATYYPGDWPNSSRAFGEPYKNMVGWLGAIISHWIFTLAGYTGYAVVVLLLIVGIVVFLHKSYNLLIKPALLLITLGIFLPMLTGLSMDIGSGNTLAVPNFRFGGIFGGLFAGFMTTYLGRLGAFVVSLTLIERIPRSSTPGFHFGFCC